MFLGATVLRQLCLHSRGTAPLARKSSFTLRFRHCSHGDIWTQRIQRDTVSIDLYGGIAGGAGVVQRQLSTEPTTELMAARSASQYAWSAWCRFTLYVGAVERLIAQVPGRANRRLCVEFCGQRSEAEV